MRITVLSRNEMRLYCNVMIKKENKLVISINDFVDGPLHALELNSHLFEHIVTQCFDDVSRPREGYTLISDEQAAEIADAVFKYKDKVDEIIIHCYAGISRSAAIAAAISKYLTGDNTEYFNYRKYTPNPLVYRKVLSALKERGKR